MRLALDTNAILDFLKQTAGAFDLPALIDEYECFTSVIAKLELLKFPGIKIEVNTLQNMLFWGAVNDISFEAGDKLVIFIEHQSTVNPNMPLRLLEYVQKIYKKRTRNSNLYGTKLVTVPRPEFFVLYNGEAPYPDENVLRLSDAFEKTAEWGVPEKAALELEVKVYNINAGRNEALARKSKTLAQYSAFIERVRAFAKEKKNLEEALALAVNDCIRRGILKEFLEKNAPEVIDMLLEEWTWEGAQALMRKEMREEVREEVLEEVREEVREERGMEIARNLLSAGSPPEFVQKITGIDIRAVLTL
ncbi:MAG: Rpn family recombination-promoting nuclease/putative transposase [Treponemataceae bacterium]|nr:MAG: Rpn family recombination-promoting nuclease/putative transposase [Treponemataceae bacterium]